jgi:6-phosphogluconolactonase (cycloisomerase 2 family)
MLMRRRHFTILMLSALFTALVSAPAVGADGGSRSRTGTVYTLTNEAGGNAVAAFNRGPDGALTPAGIYPTGGLGSGGGLGSQGAVVLSENRRLLLAVNAGSDAISSFRVASDGSLVLIDRVASGGDRPISVTIHNRLVYVLNAGGTGNISGFTVNAHGRLASLPNSTRPLSSSASDPAQISFNPSGRVLVVTEKATNLISTYTLRADGIASGPNPQASSGATPFGFEFDRRGRLFVSEAFGGAADASATSSYDLSRSGTLSVISSSVGTTETAACWVVVTGPGRFAYVTNTGSGTVSGYAIGRHGRLTLLDPDGVTAVTGTGSSPIDADLSHDSGFLFVLNDGSDSIEGFRVNGRDGSLTPAGEIFGLPASSVGLVSS